jgi:hypothetical protein
MAEYPKIDALRKKFDTDKKLTLREVCFVLWAELYVCSAQYLMFALWVKENGLHKQKMKWPLWKGLFTTFVDKDWPILRNDLDKSLKAQRLGTRIAKGQSPNFP